MSNYTHLSLDERQLFYMARQQGHSIKYIAAMLGRHRTTLYCEVKRQRSKHYHPLEAEDRAISLRTQPRKTKIETHITLRSYVMHHLKLGWSPEQIAGRLKRKKVSMQSALKQSINIFTDRKARNYIGYYHAKNLSGVQITQESLDALSNMLNTTPRKCVDYRAPKELILRHYKSDCRTSN